MSEKKSGRRVVPKLDDEAWEVPAERTAAPEARVPAPEAAPEAAGTREVKISSAATSPRGRGRPASEPTEPDAELVSTTVRVYDLDLEYLDDQVRAIRRGGGPRSTTRSEVLRGILRALRNAGIRLGSATSEEEVERLLRNYIAS